MEARTLVSSSFTSLNPCSHVIRISMLNVQDSSPTYVCFPSYPKSQHQGQRKSIVSSAFPDTAISVAVATVAVGTAATLLLKRTKSSDEPEVSSRTCEDCGGSGVCPECKGEGFILKKLSEESADKARMAAKNMATRYTAGLPKKWSYCSKCSSSRLCISCGGSGKLRCMMDILTGLVRCYDDL